MNPPTTREIEKARKVINEPSDISAMSDWRGGGWHLSEVLYGILIGLQIADDREKKRVPPAHKHDPKTCGVCQEAQG